MGEQKRGSGPVGTFEQVVLPHMDAAYNLARWLVRNTPDAEDMVQEAYLRAFKFFGGYQGGDARAWVLKIVRNTCYSFFEKNRPAESGGGIRRKDSYGGDRSRRERKRHSYNRPIAECFARRLTNCP